jgi:alkanesulfonate monooxygenase SsuD/methylene tetrahydromethanopterin reductase-like flavin-dependent oxidoreductase (luciferase family)
LVKTRYGFGLPIYSGASLSNDNLSFEDIKSSIKKCETLGYDSVWVPDHVMLGNNDRVFECWTILSAASQITEHVRLGTLVACVTHRSPALLAKMAATLDVISNGRLELGLGVGWRGSEQVAYGLPWEQSARVRVDRLRESVQIIKGLWGNEKFSFDGRYYTLKDAVCEPKPIQKPFPRIWIGGKGEKLVLKAIAEYADAWNVDEISPDEYAHKLEVLRAYCGSVGTNYENMEKSLETYMLISDRKEDLQKVVDWSRWVAQDQAEAAGMVARNKLEEIRDQYVLGSRREVTEKMAAYIEAGVQHFMIYFLDYPSSDSMTAFAKDVIPSLK